MTQNITSRNTCITNVGIIFKLGIHLYYAVSLSVKTAGVVLSLSIGGILESHPQFLFPLLQLGSVMDCLA